jgi:hypothetical protein
MRAFAGLEDRSLLREPTPELLARHFVGINNIVYVGKCSVFVSPEDAASMKMPCRTINDVR